MNKPLSVEEIRDTLNSSTGSIANKMGMSVFVCMLTLGRHRVVSSQLLQQQKYGYYIYIYICM